ncbi:uncharacterized protein TNCV_3672991 [Trichonephila clavipes]|nr:uncharacterized protein TNCV_3672991 [Trichonephila clavipes]
MGCPITELSYIRIEIVNIYYVVVASSRREGMPEPETGLLQDRWRHPLSLPQHFKHGTGGEGNILQPLAPVVSMTAHKTFVPTDLTSTYSVRTRRLSDWPLIHLQCVLSHVGLPGKKVLDDLANSDSSDPVDAKDNTVLTSTDIYSRAKELICRT